MTAATSLGPSRQELVADLSDDSTHVVARVLALLGYPVFPIHTTNDAGSCSCGKEECRNAGKHPRTANGLHDATRDLDPLATWWQRWPDANVAVATGAASDLWVLDIDPAGQGEASLAALEGAYGELDPTWCVESGGGGYHLWFRHPGASLQTSAGRLGPGLDVRADGGYIIVPPSRHRSRRRYAWADAWHPTRVDLAPAPTWLLNLLNRPAPPKMIPPDVFLTPSVRGHGTPP